MDATYAPAMDPVYHTTAHSVSGPEQFSLQPSASQGRAPPTSGSFIESIDRPLGHIAGGFARHRFDLKTQQQQQQQQQQQPVVSLPPQAMSNDQLNAVVGRGEVTTGVVQQLVQQIQHQPHPSTSSQRASTSLSAIR